jgi:hypothetical protein
MVPLMVSGAGAPTVSSRLAQANPSPVEAKAAMKRQRSETLSMWINLNSRLLEKRAKKTTCAGRAIYENNCASAMFATPPLPSLHNVSQ